MAFQWANFSKGLLREFARSVGLRVSLAAADLSAKFGEPPADDMVVQLWPTLRDRWLATRPAARERVVKELRTAGLGDKSIKLSTKTGQMAYLRSCRQSTGLRATVLAAFLDEGSQQMVATPVIVDSTPASRTLEPEANDTLDALRQADAIREEVATKPPPRITPPAQAKDPWRRPYIYDYWDSRTGAISVFSGALREPIGNEQKERITKSISAAVEEGVNKLSDKELLLMAVTMADDVYKAADCTELWDSALEKYLRASAGAFAQALAKRGYLIHYLVDNTFEKTESGMQRPIELYPMWFKAAGFVYICPQHVASMLMQKDGISRGDYIDALSRYIAEARAVSEGVVDQCRVAKRHFVYLDADSIAGGFDRAGALRSSPGIITIFRDSAPASESKVTVTLPNELTPS